MHLKRKFERVAPFHVDCVAFMHDIICCGEPEKMSAKDLGCSRGKVWYIRHHGVYHLHKRKIRVVFE